MSAESELDQVAQLLVMLSLVPESDRDTTLAQCRRLVREAAGGEGRRLAVASNLIASLNREIASLRSMDGDPIILGMCEALSEELILHHTTQDIPLAHKAFETVVEQACQAQGLIVTNPTSKTNRRWDLAVGAPGGTSENWSLKTEGGAKEATVDITKLSEAAWITAEAKLNDGNATLAAHVREYLRDYMASVQRLLVLRSVSVANVDYDGPAFMYQLIEVPVSILGAPLEWQQGEMEAKLADTKTLRVDVAGHPYKAASQDELALDPGGRHRLVEMPDHNRKFDFAYSLGLDVSDGKVKLTTVPLAVCQVYATWVLMPVSTFA